MLLALWVWWSRRTRLGALTPSAAHGSARLATWRDLRGLRAGRRTPRLALGIAEGGVVALHGAEQFQNVLVIGPPGSGKSAGLIIPNLLEETGTRSLVITDLKGELVETTLAAVSRTHDARVLDFLKPETGARYNPLAHIHDYLSALAFATTWVANTGESKSEPYWDNAARLVIAASVLHVQAANPPEDATLATLARFLTRGGAHVAEALKTSPSMAARDAASAWLEDAGANEKVLGGVFSEMPLRFSIFQDPRVAASTVRDDVDFRAMGGLEGRAQALYLVLDRKLGRELRPLTAVFFSQLFDALIGLAEETPGGALPRPVLAYIDEAGNIGSIYNFPTYLSTVRSARVGVVLAFQNRGQIKELYGEEGRDIITACCGTRAALSRTAAEDARWFSDLAGEATVVSRTSGDTRKRGAGWADRGNRGESESGRKLLTPDEVARLPEDRMLLLAGARPPVLVTQRRYYRDRRLRALARLPRPAASPDRTPQAAPCATPSPPPDAETSPAPAAGTTPGGITGASSVTPSLAPGTGGSGNESESDAAPVTHVREDGPFPADEGGAEGTPRNERRDAREGVPTSTQAAGDGAPTGPPGLRAQLERIAGRRTAFPRDLAGATLARMEDAESEAAALSTASTGEGAAPAATPSHAALAREFAYRMARETARGGPRDGLARERAVTRAMALTYPTVPLAEIEAAGRAAATPVGEEA